MASLLLGMGRRSFVASGEILYLIFANEDQAPMSSIPAFSLIRLDVYGGTLLKINLCHILIFPPHPPPGTWYVHMRQIGQLLVVLVLVPKLLGHFPPPPWP